MIWVILLPLLIALLPYRRWLAPLAPIPALWIAVTAPGNLMVNIPWLILGAELGLGEATRVFLLFTAALWTISAWFAVGYIHERAGRFHGFFLVTMAGNLGLLIARDVPLFYTCFAVMTFAAYGLVIHTGTESALRAGRIYLIMALMGEALLLGGLFLAVGAAKSIHLADIPAAVTGSGYRDMIVALLWSGFGVKAGALGLHFWLPLAHPVAPVPASAVLSGSMIKAGLFGWMAFLPVGEGSYPDWSLFLVGIGLGAAFYGVLVGFIHQDPKTNLAYSSISQMGVMSVALGIGFADASAWPVALQVLLVYALNHALAKGALFIGVGVAMHTGGRSGAVRWLVLAGLALPALSIAGAPWTGGAIAKYALKKSVSLAPAEWYPLLDFVLPLTSVATALLLGRFLWLVHTQMKSRPSERPSAALWFPWLVLLVGVAGAVALAMYLRYLVLDEIPKASAITVWAGFWPILTGLAILLSLGRFTRKWGAEPIPAGDLVVIFERAARGLGRWGRGSLLNPARWQMNIVPAFERLAESEERHDLANRLERKFRQRETGSLLFGLLVLLLFALLLWR